MIRMARSATMHFEKVNPKLPQLSALVTRIDMRCGGQAVAPNVPQLLKSSSSIQLTKLWHKTRPRQLLRSRIEIIRVLSRAAGCAVAETKAAGGCGAACRQAFELAEG